MPYRIFLSAVSTELASARDALASDLRARGLEVKVQSDFRQEVDSNTTLEKLHNYIESCDAVVCIVGERSGSSPPTIAAEPFKALLPGGFATASYTQWEYFFAKRHGRRYSIYFAKGVVPDEGPGIDEQPECQRSYVAWLKGQGLDRNYFTTVHELRAEVLREDWPNNAKPKPQNLPYPSIGPLFVGREGLMKKLYEHLTAYQQLDNRPHRAIHGLGGIGKTRLVTEYAWHHRQEYSALLFVIAETPEALRRNLAALCGPLVLNLPENAAQEEEVRLAAALGWLQQHKDWLLLVDNVDTPEAVVASEQLLGNLATGYVVYTSRMSTWAAHVQPFELGVLDEEVSTRFILQRTAGKRRHEANPEHQARLIANDLGGLALALEQACAYINERRLLLSDYYRLWREKREEVLMWYDSRVMNYPISVAVTWQRSMDQLNSDAKDLLMRLSWLSSEPVPEWLLDIKTDASDTLDARSGLAELTRYSLVSQYETTRFFGVHRLVQEVVTGQQLRDGIASGSIGALIWLCEAVEGDPQDVRRHKKLEPLFPHVLSVCEWGEGFGAVGPVLHLLMHLSGYLMYYRADYRNAEVVLRRALDLSQKRNGIGATETLGCMNNLAQLLKITHHLLEAESLLRQTIAVVIQSHGASDCRLSGFLSNLGTLLIESSRSAEAVPILREALAIANNCDGPGSEAVARCSHNLAEALSLEDDLLEAEAHARYALGIAEKNLGEDHPNVAAVLICLARILNQPGKRSESEVCLRRALGIKRKHLPKDHPDLALAVNNLGEFLEQDGRIDEARPLLREQLVSLMTVSLRNGRRHPYAVRGIRTYARFLVGIGMTKAEVTEELKALRKEAVQRASQE